MSVAGDAFDTGSHSREGQYHGIDSPPGYSSSSHSRTHQWRSLPVNNPRFNYGAARKAYAVRVGVEHPERPNRRRWLNDSQDKKPALPDYVTATVLLMLAIFIGCLIWNEVGRFYHSIFPGPITPEEIEKYRRSGISWDTPQPLDCLDKYYYRQYTARLQNISLSEDFDITRVCKALPIEVKGHIFDYPSECQHAGGQMHGFWTVYDPSDCTIEDEIRRYRNSGMFWDTPEPAKHCHSYDKREYEAQLLDIHPGYDRNKACRYITIKIHDQELEKPDSCEHRASGMFGKWIVSGQMDCKPFWGDLNDIGCQASGKKRYEARLWNLRQGDDWLAMCASTPATVNGKYYPHPTICDSRWYGGMIGIWEEEDCS